MKSYVYILKCADGQYYTGSTVNLEERIRQHQSGEGANFTRKRLPVKLIYYEIYDGIEFAFKREKQLQGWGRKKKEALIQSAKYKLHELAECKNPSHYLNQRKLKEEGFNS
jgi:putative endonuclease